MSESLRRHPLIKVLFRVKNSRFNIRNSDYKKGYKDCMYLVFKHISGDSKSMRILELEKELDGVKQIESKKLRRELSTNVLGLIKKDRYDQAIELLERWKEN